MKKIKLTKIKSSVLSREDSYSVYSAYSPNTYNVVGTEFNIFENHNGWIATKITSSGNIKIKGSSFKDIKEKTLNYINEEQSIEENFWKKIIKENK